MSESQIKEKYTSSKSLINDLIRLIEFNCNALHIHYLHHLRNTLITESRHL